MKPEFTTVKIKGEREFLKAIAEAALTLVTMNERLSAPEIYSVHGVLLHHFLWEEANHLGQISAEVFGEICETWAMAVARGEHLTEAPLMSAARPGCRKNCGEIV